MGWTLIIIGGIVEIFWVSGLKYANTPFTHALTGLGIVTSFYCMIQACKSVEVSVAYAVFVGIGTAGVVLSEMLIFDSGINFARIALIFALLGCVIGLKLASRDN